MKRFMAWLAVPAVLCFLFCSCGGGDASRKETFPVSGEILVDGQPAAELAVRCVDVSGIDKEDPTFSQAFTDEEGKFQIATYEAADGVPEGEYVLMFMWGKWNRISGNYGGPDKLNNRYMDPRKSQHRFKVEKGEPTDLGKIELTTK